MGCSDYRKLAERWGLPPELRFAFVQQAPEFIIGADEVGYGAWAGPYTVCAVVAPVYWTFEGLRDSKKLGPKRCQQMSGPLRECASRGEMNFHLMDLSNLLIDQMGAKRALERTYASALGRAIRAVSGKSFMVFLDGNLTIGGVTSVCMPKADNHIPVVMAASIIAKAHRDEEMRVLHNRFPAYDWENNVGYNSPKHSEGLSRAGVSPYHRKTYAPIRERLLQTSAK